jgi:drug/metabolite transporter (DMT)-like permease
VSRRGWLLFVAVAILWGMPFLFIKVAVDAGLAAALIAFARVALGALTLLPVAVARRALNGLARRRKPLVALAVCDVAAPFLLITIGEQSVSSSLAGILVASTPLLVALLALRLDAGERPGRSQLVGLLVGFTGVVALLGLSPGAGGGSPTGAALILGASLLYAAATLIVKHHFSDLPALGVGTATLAVSAVLLAVPAAVTADVVSPPARVIAALAALGVACTGLAFWTYYALIAEAGATRAAVSIYLTPVVAVILGVSLLDERLTVATAAGLALILVGSRLSTRRPMSIGAPCSQH